LRQIALIIVSAMIGAGLLVSTAQPAQARTAWLDTKVTFVAESHRKPTTCTYGRVKAQGSAGRAQPVKGVRVLIQRKYNSGWKTVKTTTTQKGGWYGVCLKAGYGKRRDDYRAAVRPFKISRSNGVTYKGRRDVSKSHYLWKSSGHGI
jgi:hypothetical protein